MNSIYIQFKETLSLSHPPWAQKGVGKWPDKGSQTKEPARQRAQTDRPDRKTDKHYFTWQPTTDIRVGRQIFLLFTDSEWETLYLLTLDG